MSKIDADSLLDDFKGEARTHIEKIESAFLDVEAFAGDPALMDGVFRAAHSIKGTAGFFSLEKIVAVAHALESVFSRIKSGELALNDEIADVTLESVDCLKDLVNNVNTPDAVDTDGILELLRSYSGTQKPQKTQNAQKTQKREEGAWEIQMPFDLKSHGAGDLLKGTAKRGHRAYYLDVKLERDLGRYDSNPKGLIDDIVSIGIIVEAMVDDVPLDAPDPSGLAAIITDKLTEPSASSLKLLVSSVLEPELFLVAVELDSRYVHPIPKEAIFVSGSESGESKETTERKTEKPASEAGAAPAHPLQQTNDLSIRLDVSAINGLMDLANEMILTRNQLISSMSAHRKTAAGVMPVLRDVSRLTSEFQEKVLRTRMQPISVVFGKFPRMIRDTAKALNKDIQIKILGGDVALDKYLLDSLSDPITQLVKNSADHGIENAERRAALDKPQKGTITLNAYMRDGLAVIEVSDDGAGIDTEALKRKSLERGTASEEQLAAMTKNALFHLIFEPGLSTAKQVTNVSGRGVGMDIVKTNIEKLGGSIEIESELDKGTTMRLKTPLTLSVIRTLIVTINSVQYAVPETNVERIVRVSKAQPSKRLERINNSLALNLNGWIIPAVTIEDIDARAKGLEPPSAEDIIELAQRRGVTKLLVLKARDKAFALLIDDAIETEETLIKPLPIYLRNCRCYSSTTVLGNGNAAMILDAEGIMRFMKIEGADKAERNEAWRAETAGEKISNVIVFKCSGAEDFALYADKISRIERIDPGHIQEIGGRQFVNIAEKTVQVIRPEDYVPVQKRAYDKNRLYMLMLAAGAPDAAMSDPDMAEPNMAKSPAGLLAGRVLDKIEGSFELDGNLFDSEYVFGTGVYNEKILIFLNSDEIARSAASGI